MKNYGLLIFILIFFGSFCTAQNDSTYYYFNRVTPIEKIASKVESTKSSSLKSFYQLVYFSKVREQDSILYYIDKIDSNSDLPKSLQAKFAYFKAYYYKITDQDSLAYKFHDKSLKLARKFNDSLTILHSLSGLSQSWDYDGDNPYRMDYLNELEAAANQFDNKSFKIIQLYLKGNYYLFRDKNNKAVRAYKDVLKLEFGTRDSTNLLNTYNNLGALYDVNLNMPDSAIYFYTKKLALINTNEKFRYPNNYFDTYVNIGNSYLSKKDYGNALHYFTLADSIELKESIVFNKLLLNENLSRVNSELKNYEAAYNNLNSVIKFSDSLKEKEHREGIARIKEQFDNEKLRADNLESEAKRRQNETIAIGLGSGLLAVGIFAFLIYKNTKRKQRIAEQEREIEIRKTEKILKEQELTTIDAMISGQEKERQRLAGDLHDSVGATLAAAKLQFSHLRANHKKADDLDTLFTSTEELLNQAYDEVRSMAHLKNSGVIAKNGLLPAIEKLAKNASWVNNLKVDVQSFGLDERLENSLEIAIFRIIQELVTNVIKHARALEASISITQHDDSLSIIVEDNGVGFDAKNIQQKDGMGLSGIERRVEHLEGTMEIDSTPKKGTSVLIDIPL